jgi:hypothetical protein
MRLLSHKFLIFTLAIAAVLTGGPSAAAGTLTFALTGSGASGTFNGSAFTNETFSITGTADTSSLAIRSFNHGDALSLQLTSLVYTIGSNPAASAVTPSDFYVAQTENVTDGSVSIVNLDFTAGTVFWADASGWDVVSSFGPAASEPFGSGGVLTDQGMVSVAVWDSATFTATASSVPEPASVGLVGLGGLAAVLARRYRVSGGR